MSDREMTAEPAAALRPSRSPDEVEAFLRRTLAQLIGRDQADVDALPDATPLLRDGLDLSSLDGAALLDAVRQHYGVDLAAIDLGLTSLESIASLRDFISQTR
jgi:acyl carrier protein